MEFPMPTTPEMLVDLLVRGGIVRAYVDITRAARRHRHFNAAKGARAATK